MNETPEQMLARLEARQCWYPLALCNRAATATIIEHGNAIGYCRNHAAEMRARYQARVVSRYS